MVNKIITGLLCVVNLVCVTLAKFNHDIESMVFSGIIAIMLAIVFYNEKNKD